ncbi:MAG: outer membrane beta-barrel domain-containing protein [Pseudobdellovibrionaceae bacterium]
MRNGFLLGTAAFFAVIQFWSPDLRAQEEDMDGSADVDQIEAELERKTAKPSPAEQEIVKEEKLEDFSGLGKLAPFSEISVIQKRFMPKSKRFEFFAGLANVVNDPWFMGTGFDARLGYHFTETWGAELTGVFLSNSKRQAIKDLYDQHGVQTDSIITAKNYIGGSLVWTPIYGKMGLFNRRIVPFDMYFALGGGSTGVDGGDGGNTLHLGTGQIFAISKGMGFRWDFSWNSFNATPKGASAQNFNSLLLTFGLSFFFPEAKYR